MIVIVDQTKRTELFRVRDLPAAVYADEGHFVRFARSTKIVFHIKLARHPLKNDHPCSRDRGIGVSCEKSRFQSRTLVCIRHFIEDSTTSIIPPDIFA